MMQKTSNANGYGIALFLVGVMLLSPLIGLSGATTFGNGSDSVKIEVREGDLFINSNDGSISLPGDESVTSASFKVSTAMASHKYVNTIDGQVQHIWDPAYNSQQTSFSNAGDFSYQGDNVALTSDGFSTDFERTLAGFSGLPGPGAQWEHGSLADGEVLLDNCNSGEDCWGTNVHDDDYTDDWGGSSGRTNLITPAIQISPTGTVAKFETWFGLHWTENSVNDVRYNDCAYVMVRNSSAASNFPPPDQGWTYIPVTLPGSQTYQVGAGHQKIQTCSGLSIGNMAIGGESSSPQNPGGWVPANIDLSAHISKYVQLRFTLSFEDSPRAPENMTMPGWYIDDFRVGSKLPQSGSMTVHNIAPRQIPNPGFPNGYGVLSIEAETTPTNSLTVDILQAGTTTVVIDDEGNPLSGLEGSIIELWNLNSSKYPFVDVRFVFDTGQLRLSTSKLYGFSIGSRVGTGFNNSNSVIGAEDIQNGVWTTMGGFPIMYQPTILDKSYSPPIERITFSKPILKIKPTVLDSCAETPTISVETKPGELLNLTVGSDNQLTEPIHGFMAMIQYSSYCEVSEIWFDLTFGHHSSGIRIDVAADGDVEWGMVEPAFGEFGLQNVFWQNKLNGTNYATDTASITLGGSGTGSGADFMLPVGAEIWMSSFNMDQNTIFSTLDEEEGFDLSLSANGQSASIGSVPNASTIISSTVDPPLDLSNAIESLMANPGIKVDHTDAYGNEWYRFKFEIDSPNATTGTSVVLRDLNIMYNWSRVLDESNDIDRELSQGVALQNSSEMVDVPVEVSATGGGAILLSDLDITSDSGYDTTISVTNNPVGLYPDGSIYEVITTHEVASSTGASFAGAYLLFESATGKAEISYSDITNNFEIASDDLNILVLESSTAADLVGVKEITWRFRVTTEWQDTPEVIIFSGLIADNGVSGLPAAIVMAPEGGMAVENDARITAFSLANSAGEVQNLDDAESNRIIKVTGSVRLESLDVAPDPNSYNISIQKKVIGVGEGNITWDEVSNQTGPIGGDFDWTVDLGIFAAGTETYRFIIGNYTGGTTLCPSNSIPHDEDCGINFNLTIDTFSPSLVNISVLSAPTLDPKLDTSWRLLMDDTWVLPHKNQLMKVIAQDIPEPPASLDLMYWVEYDHDVNSDGIADESEYQTLVITTDGMMPTANYSGYIDDSANEGQDPAGKVSIYVTGFDAAGNSINGGSAGFEDDLVTYVGMSSKRAQIANFFILDSEGNPLYNIADDEYQGPWNSTMYAGKDYHLRVEALDDNGWRDIDHFKIDLNPGTVDDMVIKYWPRNDTYESTSQWVEVLDGEGEPGVQMVGMDGNRLVDPFEDTFVLDIPIRLAWNAYTVKDKGTLNPAIRIKDMDNSAFLLANTGGSHKQSWMYSDGIQLDFRNEITPNFEDLSTPVTDDVQIGFVYPSDTINFQGRYVYKDGIPYSVFISPEIPLTLRITREDASADPSKGYEQYDGDTTYHVFENGTFNINLIAPSKTNVYSYFFELVKYDEVDEDNGLPAGDENKLPQGAEDFTISLCDGSDSYGCGKFTLMVDANYPTLVSNTWTAKDANDVELTSIIPSSTLDCFSAEVLINEREGLLTGEVDLAWMFFLDVENNLTWPSANIDTPMRADMSLKRSSDNYIASVDCIDINSENMPADPTQMEGVTVVFWVEGRDSSGWPISGSSWGNPIYGTSDKTQSSYLLKYEQAKFKVQNVFMTPKAPVVGDEIELDITLVNLGTKSGNITLTIQSVIDDGNPVPEATITSGEIGPLETGIVTVRLAELGGTTTGMYLRIMDASCTGNCDPLWGETPQRFNVKVAPDDSSSGSMGLIIAGFGGIILILLVVVVVLVIRNRDSEGYEDDEEYEYEDEKELATIPAQSYERGYGETSPSHSLGGYSDQVSDDPEMTRALSTFPQWDRATIQGYFDQGWSVEALQDWVNENK